MSILHRRVYGRLTWKHRFDAIRKAREWMLTLDTPLPPIRQLSQPLSPRYSADDLLALVNPDIRKPFDMSEVLLRIVDDSRLLLFKPEYGRNLITAFTTIIGMCFQKSLLTATWILLYIWTK